FEAADRSRRRKIRKRLHVRRRIKRTPSRGRLLEAEKTDPPDMHAALVNAATNVHHTAPKRRVQPFVAAGRQKIDSQLRTVEGEAAELLHGVDHEEELVPLCKARVRREIDTFTGHPAD